MTGTILVTGATGNVGGELVRILKRQGQEVRAAVRSEARAAQLPAPGIPWVPFNFGNRETYRQAFAGVDRLFLIGYSNPSLARFAWRLWRRGYPPGYIGVVSAIYTTTRFGLSEKVTLHTTKLLGRPPITMRQFVEDYAASWLADSQRAAAPA